jgi:hypothetical protein
MIDYTDLEDTALLSFLETLLNRYKNGLLTDDEKQRLHAYYRDELFKDCERSDDKKMLEYLTLGWYIHTYLLNK